MKFDPTEKPPRKPQRLGRFYDREHIKAGQAFRTTDGHVFVVKESGAFVRLDKDHRNRKERKRARRNTKQGRGV
jgi:hypothetical protein